MSEQANIQTLKDHAQQLNEEVRTRIEKINQDARELYTKVEDRITELLEEYKGFEKPVDALKDSSNKLQQSAREIQQQQFDRLGSLSTQLVERLGLTTQSELKNLEKKVTTLNNKVKKLEKAAKPASKAKATATKKTAAKK